MSYPSAGDEPVDLTKGAEPVYQPDPGWSQQYPQGRYPLGHDPQGQYPPYYPPPPVAAQPYGSTVYPPGYGPSQPFAPGPAAPYPPVYPSPWGGGVRIQGTNGMAIASMVLGIVWLYWVGSILAVIFGFIARSQIRQNHQDGEGMAIAGLVLGFLGIATLLIVIGFLAA